MQQTSFTNLVAQEVTSVQMTLRTIKDNILIVRSNLRAVQETIHNIPNNINAQTDFQAILTIQAYVRGNIQNIQSDIRTLQQIIQQTTIQRFHYILNIQNDFHDIQTDIQNIQAGLQDIYNDLEDFHNELFELNLSKCLYFFIFL